MPTGSGSEDSLASQLSDLANNTAQPTRPQPTPTTDDQAHDHHDGLAGMARESSAASSTAPAPRPPVRKGQKDVGLKVVAVVVMQAVGLLLLLPALWGTLLLLDYEVSMSERENAQFMAKIMLVCWPVAVVLIACASGLLWHVLQVRRANR